MGPDLRSILFDTKDHFLQETVYIACNEFRVKSINKLSLNFWRALYDIDVYAIRFSFVSLFILIVHRMCIHVLREAIYFQQILVWKDVIVL